MIGQVYDLGVHLHRWDAEFRVWDLEATFRLYHLAQTATKALSELHPEDVYRLDDTRGYATLVEYVANGTVSDEDPRYTDTTISNEE